jgi:hypothetical protein
LAPLGLISSQFSPRTFNPTLPGDIATPVVEPIDLGNDYQFAVKVEDWAVLLIQDGGVHDFPSTGDPILGDFMKLFVNECESADVKIVHPVPLYTTAALPRVNAMDPGRTVALNAISTVIKNLDTVPTFIMVVLSNSDQNILNGIRRICDISLRITMTSVHAAHIRGIHTSIAKSSFGSPHAPQILKDEARRLYLRLGGDKSLSRGNPGLQSELVECLRPATMVVGIHIIQDESEMSGTRIPAVVGVVANVHENLVQFPASVFLLKPILTWASLSASQQLLHLSSIPESSAGACNSCWNHSIPKAERRFSYKNSHVLGFKPPGILLTIGNGTFEVLVQVIK